MFRQQPPGNMPNSKVHGVNMGPIWGRQDPGGPHVGPMNPAIWDALLVFHLMKIEILMKLYQSYLCGPCSWQNNLLMTLQHHSRWSTDMTLTKLMLPCYLMSSWGKRTNIDWRYARRNRSVKWLQIHKGLNGTGLISWKLILSMITHMYISFYSNSNISEDLKAIFNKKKCWVSENTGSQAVSSFCINPRNILSSAPVWLNFPASLDEVTTVIANKQDTICPAGILEKINWTNWGGGGGGGYLWSPLSVFCIIDMMYIK